MRETPNLNYSHHFHAGNFADVHKHALLLPALQALGEAPGRLQVLDTHAGAGLYDLTGELAQRSGEAELGIRRLLLDADAPAGFAPLKAAFATLNRPGELKLYPGSPVLIAQALRRGDSYVGCELRADDVAALRRTLEERSRKTGADLVALQRDGFEVAAKGAGGRADRTLLLIDPPYERADDYARIEQALAAALRGQPDLSALVWAPIKDLETYDALLRRLETLPFVQGWAAEARLRPLTDPMRLNGSAVIGLGLPPPEEAQAITAWVAASAGEGGALGQVRRLFD